MYTKLFRSITSSSVWIEDSDTVKLWVFLLAEADKKGFVFGSLVTIADRCKVPLDKARAVLGKFSQPDPHSSDLSRNPGNEGRRIEAVNGGWRVINLEHYRDLQDADVRRLQKTERQRKWRRRPSTRVDACRRSSTLEVPSDTDTTPDADTDIRNTPAMPASAERSWRGLGQAAVAVARTLDRRLRQRDEALALPDKLAAEHAITLNKLLVGQEANRVRFAVWWAFDDAWFREKLVDVPSLVANFKRIISGSTECWSSLKDDLGFLDE